MKSSLRSTNKIKDNTEAFDKAIAIWYWLSHWHGGQTCDKYAAMCQLGVKHKLNVKEDLDDSTQHYYDELNEDNWESEYQELDRYLDDEWEDN